METAGEGPALEEGGNVVEEAESRLDTLYRFY